MKILNIKVALLMIAALVMSSCETIEDRDTLSNSFNPDDLELTVVQATNGGNKLSIQMNSKGATGYWDYIIGEEYSNRVEVVFPFTGEHTFTFNVTTPYMPNGNPGEIEYVKKTVKAQVTTIDERLADEYYLLIGDNLEGKTWVLDGVGGDERIWWAMVAPYNHEEVWWNAGGTCCPPSDVGGSMTFDLAGGANYTYRTDAAGEATEVGSFDYAKITDGKLIVPDAKMLGYDEARVNPDGVYEIIELTADKLVIFTPTNGGGTGWKWVFRAQ